MAEHRIIAVAGRLRTYHRVSGSGTRLMRARVLEARRLPQVGFAIISQNIATTAAKAGNPNANHHQKIT